jgi:hypothetical protein
MRRLAIALMLVGALAAPAAVSAHPSENRAPQGFGSGPHCHINLKSGVNVYPSHTAHVATGGGSSPIFTAIAQVDCPD